MKIRNLNKRKTLKESVEDMSKSDLVGAYGRPDYVTAVGEINKNKEDTELNRYFPNNKDDKEYKAEGDRYFISGRKEDDKVLKHLGITEGKKNKNKRHLSRINEGYNNREIYSAVIRHFDYSGTSEFMDLMTELVDRALVANQGDTNEDVWDAIDSGLFEYKDKWQVIEHYESPAISDETYEELVNDLASIVDELREDDEEDEDEDFEEGLTKKNIRESYCEVASIGNEEGPIYTVYYGGFDTFDSLVPVEDENGDRVRLSMYDVMNDYYWYDRKGNIIHEPYYEDEDFEESFNKKSSKCAKESFKNKKNFKNNKRVTRG